MSTAKKKVSRPPARPALVKLVHAALEDMKAVNIKMMDVRGVTDVADCMVLASGNSDRHVRSIADRVVEKAKAAGFRPLGKEGERDGEWVLVDLNDVIVHVMLPRVREFYALESLWEVPEELVREKVARSRNAAASRSAPAKKKVARKSAVAKKSAPVRAKSAGASRAAARFGARAKTASKAAGSKVAASKAAAGRARG
jgi:ribosome-associated protein